LARKRGVREDGGVRAGRNQLIISTYIQYYTFLVKEE
jgi:hypothetical protein